MCRPCKLELTPPRFTDSVSLDRNVAFICNHLHLIRRILFLKTGVGEIGKRNEENRVVFNKQQHFP